jgi:hypothetical protein
MPQKRPAPLDFPHGGKITGNEHRGRTSGNVVVTQDSPTTRVATHAWL